MSWLEARQFLDEDNPDGALYYWKSIYLERFDAEVMATLTEHTKKRPSPASSIDNWFPGGAMNRVPASNTPFHKRDAAVTIAIEANWNNPAEIEANIAWARTVYADLERFSDGSSCRNFPGFMEDRALLLQAAYGANLPKLREIKSKYDPGNLFPGLLNISPR